MRKQNLVLMTGIALIVLMAVSIIAFSWPWSASGDATNSTSWSKTTYYVYDGKTKPITVNGVGYIFNSVIGSKNNATLSIEGESINLVKGDIKSFENYPVEIRVKKISYNLKKPSKSYVGFNVRKSEASENGVSAEGESKDRPTLTEYVESYGAQKMANNRNPYSGISIHTIDGDSSRWAKIAETVYFIGSSWDCTEWLQDDYKTTDDGGNPTTKPYISYTIPRNAAVPNCFGSYGDISVGDVCVLMRNHPCTGKDEWVAVYYGQMKNDPHLLNLRYDDITLVPYYVSNPSTGSVDRITGRIPSYYEYDWNKKTATPTSYEYDWNHDYDWNEKARQRITK